MNDIKKGMEIAEDERLSVCISQSKNIEDPRMYPENLGTMVLWEQGQGGNKNITIPDIVKENNVYLPIYYDKKTNTLSHRKDKNVQSDVAKIGYIYASNEEVMDRYDGYNDDTVKQMKRTLKAELYLYDCFKKGNFWDYELKKGDKVIDKVEGLIGDMNIVKDTVLKNYVADYQKLAETENIKISEVVYLVKGAVPNVPLKDILNDAFTQRPEPLDLSM